ncbi:hypothetical protein DXZ20_07010 [Leptolyngbyaceae cyanobacterium CCMR0081]|uniref:Uncharacterized protein n=1 Tax=Adonisia turfae CCMR0081 TaxID=2292702 RepID=A0A6M0RH00_9CYAN|nr:hypothetical protein [Adonisia turfae CCMR0081]
MRWARYSGSEPYFFKEAIGKQPLSLSGLFLAFLFPFGAPGLLTFSGSAFAATSTTARHSLAVVGLSGLPSFLY